MLKVVQFGVIQRLTLCEISDGVRSRILDKMPILVVVVVIFMNTSLPQGWMLLQCRPVWNRKVAEMGTAYDNSEHMCCCIQP